MRSYHCWFSLWCFSYTIGTCELVTSNAAVGPQELALRLRQLRGRLPACGYAEFVKVCGQRVGDKPGSGSGV